LIEKIMINTNLIDSNMISYYMINTGDGHLCTYVFVR
jgi:hypothetical protein